MGLRGQVAIDLGARMGSRTVNLYEECPTCQVIDPMSDDELAGANPYPYGQGPIDVEGGGIGIGTHDRYLHYGQVGDALARLATEAVARQRARAEIAQQAVAVGQVAVG